MSIDAIPKEIDVNVHHSKRSCNPKPTAKVLLTIDHATQFDTLLCEARLNEEIDSPQPGPFEPRTDSHKNGLFAIPSTSVHQKLTEMISNAFVRQRRLGFVCEMSSVALMRTVQGRC
jgi:hypothetical protein